MPPTALDLPGPSRRITVKPVHLPEPAREPEPREPEPREPDPEQEPAPAEKPTPEREPEPTPA